MLDLDTIHCRAPYLAKNTSEAAIESGGDVNTNGCQVANAVLATAVRARADAMSERRPAPAVPAASVMLLHDGREGLEILMLLRHPQHGVRPRRAGIYRR